MCCVLTYTWNDNTSIHTREEWLEKFVDDESCRVVFFGTYKECVEYINS